MKKLLLAVLLLVLWTSPAFAKPISAAISAGWPPLEFHNEQAELAGLSVDYAQALSQHLGMPIELVEVAWSQVFSGLLAGDYDIILSSVSITGERASLYSFSDKYMSVRQALLIKQGAPQVKFAGLNGQRIGVREYTTSYYLGKSYGARVKYFVELNEALNAMLNDELDAVLCDSPVAFYYKNVNPQYRGKVTISDLDSEREDYGIVLRQDDRQLLQELNQAIAALNEDGTMGKLQMKWLGIELK